MWLAVRFGLHQPVILPFLKSLGRLFVLVGGLLKNWWSLAKNVFEKLGARNSDRRTQNEDIESGWGAQKRKQSKDEIRERVTRICYQPTNPLQHHLLISAVFSICKLNKALLQSLVTLDRYRSRSYPLQQVILSYLINCQTFHQEL